MQNHTSLRIGMLVPDLSHKHGWAHYSLSLIQALKRAGADLTVVAAKNSPDVEGLTVHKLLPNTLPAEQFSLLKQWFGLPHVRAILRDCDVIHATIEPYAPLAAWVAGERRLFVTGHGSYVAIADERRWPASILYGRALRKSQLVCVSHYTEKVARGALPGVRTVVVNNGVDAGRFASIDRSTRGQSVGNGLRPSLTKLHDAKTVLAVGAVKARKGTLELVRAMAGVQTVMPDVRCIVIGSLEADRSYAGRVRSAIAELGLGDCVQLLGHVPENVVMDWYKKADVFALPSMNVNGRFEGYGLVYLEASAAGLPVIGTTGCGAEDAIDDGLTGLLIPQSQVASTATGGDSANSA